MKPNKVKQLLLKSIREVASKREFLQNPNSDFTRIRKLPFEKVVKLILSMGGATLDKELLDFFHLSPDAAGSSAFVQQRAKISYAAFENLFHLFSQKTDTARFYRGYRLFAVDGSDLHIPTNPHDPESFYPGANGQKPYNLLHLNALYDLLSHTYQDAIIQKGVSNENGAVIDMLLRSPASNALLIADRGYESYNLMAHCQEKGWSFLIRVKDLTPTGIAASLDLPHTDQFDVPVSLSITRRQGSQARTLHNYKFLPSNARFDFLPHTSRKNDPITFYPLHFRVVRFKITPDAYETVLTNLPANTFPSEELKRLYAMRWGIETSFRDLKYTIGLLHFHSKKTEFIFQEVFAALTMYNFAEAITQSVVIRHAERKYLYQVNFSQAAYICRQFFRSNISPPSVETLIAKYIVPIRPDRHNARNLAVKSALSFLYRVA